MMADFWFARSIGADTKEDIDSIGEALSKLSQCDKDAAFSAAYKLYNDRYGDI